MKNILLATTALFATAGFAAAEVSLSGSAEMGIFGGSTDEDGAEDTETQFHTDIDVTFTMSGTTDGGLTFGADIDLDESDGDDDNDETVDLDFNDDGVVDATVTVNDGASAAFAGDTQGGEAIFVSGAFGTITMGDTDGAFDRAMTEAIIGADLIDSNEHAGYNGNAGLDGLYDGQVARYDYTFGDFSFSASLELDDTQDNTVNAIDLGTDGLANDVVDGGDPIFGLGVTYTFPLFGDEHTVGLGYQQTEDLLGIDSIDGADADVDANANIIGISADLNFGDFDVILNYSQADIDNDLQVALAGDDGFDPTHFGLAVGYTFDALTLAVNYGEYDEWILNSNPDTSGIGFIANYDLGGGLEAQFGYSQSTLEDADADGDDIQEDAWSLGLAMSF